MFPNVMSIGILLSCALFLGGIALFHNGVEQALNNKEGLTGESLLKILGGANLALAGGLMMFKQVVPLRAMLGITLVIASAYFLNEALKGIKDGEITTQDVLKALGSAIGLGVGVGLLTGNAYLALAISLTSITFTALQIGREQMWYPLKKILDIAEQNSITGTWLKTTNLTILFDMISFEFSIAKNTFRNGYF